MQPGWRVFDVSAQGQDMFTGFDVLAEAGEILSPIPPARCLDCLLSEECRSDVVAQDSLFGNVRTSACVSACPFSLRELICRYPRTEMGLSGMRCWLLGVRCADMSGMWQGLWTQLSGGILNSRLTRAGLSPSDFRPGRVTQEPMMPCWLAWRYARSS